MRSRYSAYALDDTDYVLRSWHPDTRPPGIATDPALRWTGLDVLSAEAGGLFDSEGAVEFVAHYSESGRPGEMRERSRFLRVDGAWLYWGPAPTKW
jgi:SEC-C motif-containing protein